MGGKTWRAEEEQFFWEVLIPQSPEGADPSQRRYSWNECAGIMREKMGHLGLRMYTKQLLYEHFYQNCKSSRPSPRAKRFVRAYLSQRGPMRVQRAQRETSSDLSTSSDNSTDSDDANHLAAGSQIPFEQPAETVRPSSTEVTGSEGFKIPEIPMRRIPLPASAPLLGVGQHYRPSPTSHPRQMLSHVSAHSRAGLFLSVSTESTSIDSNEDGGERFSSASASDFSRGSVSKDHGPRFEALLMATSGGELQLPLSSSFPSRADTFMDIRVGNDTSSDESPFQAEQVA